MFLKDCWSSWAVWLWGSHQLLGAISTGHLVSKNNINIIGVWCFPGVDLTWKSYTVQLSTSIQKKSLWSCNDIHDNHFNLWLTCQLQTLKINFSNNYFEFSIFIILIESEVLKISRATTRICCQKLIACFFRKQFGTVVLISPILDQWRLNINLETGFHKICYLLQSSRKWTSWAFVPVFSHIIAKFFQPHILK